MRLLRRDSMHQSLGFAEFVACPMLRETPVHRIDRRASAYAFAARTACKRRNGESNSTAHMAMHGR